MGEKPTGSGSRAETGPRRSLEAALRNGGEIKMVPSDPSISSFSDRHARSEHGIRIRRDVGPLLPAAGFIQPRINAPVRVRLYRSGRSLLLDTAFHSPAATADLSTNSRGRVDAPGLHLRNVPIFNSDPFGYALPPPFGFLSPPGARSIRATRCQIPFQDLSTVLRLSLPFRTSRSFGIIALHLIPIDSGLP